ncbi:peptidase M26 [Segatella buccae]
MKTKNIIQRLCLFLFALVLALPAVATNYDREGYEIFRSRKTVEQVGKNKRVYELRQGPVKIWFDDGKTTSGTGSSAIYELKKGSRIQVFADDGYAIRWIILRDTEGGKRYSDPEGIKRIDRVSSGYSYYFERNAISNSHISGGNQNQLNDDDNNIVVQQYDATNKIIVIYTHNNSKWDQFKVRDIIVGYVRKPKVRYTREQYNIYSTLESFDPYLKRDGHTGDVKWVLDNPDIADISGNGYVRPKRPGMGTLTATFSADRACAKVQCSTTINVQRDRVNFTAKDLPNMLFDKYDFRSHIKTSTASKKEFRWDNPQLSITSSNSSILSCDNGTLKPGGTAGEATITLRQKQNDLYEAATFSHTFIVMRKDQDGTVLIKDANEWKLFCKLVNDKGMTNLNARLEADIDLEWEIAMVSNDYAGTFDGQNHTLKFIWYVESDSYIAPFKKVKDATIKNLRTEGEIYGKTHYFSGLITEVYGKTAITGCVSNVNITSYYSGDRCAAAGMISYIGSGANVTITDCIVKGKFNAIMDNARKGISGFVYAQNGICTLTNCLYIGKNNATDNSYTFADNATIKNCYFLDACGSKQGEQVTADQLKNGEVAYKLQNSRNNTVWGLAFGSDAPQLTDNVEYRVYKVDFTYNNDVRATRYATRNKHIYGSLPTVQEILGTGYNPQHYYSGLTFADNFSGSTSVTADKQVAVSFTHKVVCEIASKADWKEFCNLVNGGQTKLNAKMTANVDLGSDITMAGTDDHKYAGMFDGQEHSLTLNWNAGSKHEIAPFMIVNDATIKNLHTKGEIKANSHALSGLVCAAYGTTTLSGCFSEVNITSSYNEGSCAATGMIQSVRPNAKVTITDCIVKGKFTATTDNGKKYMGGFVCNQEGTCTLTNCLYIGKNNATGGYTFTKNANTDHCYFLNACGNEQGEKITEEQLKNGYVAYKLQNGRNTQFWGQNLDTDNEPQLTADAAKHVYEVKFTYNNKVAATRYANSGKAIAGGMPTLTAKDLLGTGYNPHHYYTIAFAGGFNGSTTVDADRTVTVTLTEKDCYEIASKEDWKEFCDLVNDGRTAINAKLMNDVDLSEEITMAGTIRNYNGTFDGQGHTLTLNWNSQSGEVAPFKFVNNATIKNLRVNGKIKSDGRTLSALVCNAVGNVTLSGCVSEVDITSNYHGVCELAGMIAYVNDRAEVAITDCVVKGAFNSMAADKKGMAGFVYLQTGYCTLTNCLYAGTNNATAGSYTFGSNTIRKNCYYLNPCGKAQGERIVEKQLESGEVAYKLQGDRTDSCHWAQVLGEWPGLYREADKAKPNYVYYNKDNNGWACDDFRLTDGQSLPIGLDFTAANVTYERKFNGTQNATLCLPYDLYAQGFKAYTLSGGNKNEVHFKEVDDKLTAYTPYYITANGMPQLGGRNIEVKAYKADKMTTPAAGYKFTGTVAGVSNATAAAANAYILQDDGKFHKVTTANSAATIPAYRAYIICPPQASGAKQLSVVLDGETTGIGGVTNEAPDGKNGPVYDLQGHRVADRLDAAARHRLPAGVYIVGGRKVVVK